MNENAEDQHGPLDHAKLARLTTDIVVAYTAKNATAVADLPHLIGTVGDHLKALGGQQPEAAAVKSEPAVPIRRSISPDAITCLICGKSHKTLKRHLATAHNLGPAEYRDLFGLKPDYPLIAPRYAKKRSEVAKRIGLGRK